MNKKYLKSLILAVVIAIGIGSNIFATENYEWSELPKLPMYQTNISNPLLLPINDKIYSFGGMGFSDNKLFEYDIKSKTWVDKSKKGFQIWSTTAGVAEVAGDKAYIIHGHNPDMVIYNPSDDSNTLIPSGYVQSDAARGNEGTIFSKLGDAGDCEQISSWTSLNGSSLSASKDDDRIGNHGEYAVKPVDYASSTTFVSSYVFGKQSIKITPLSEYGGMTTSIKNNIDSSKYYFATGYIKTNGTGSDGAKITLSDADGVAIGGDATNLYTKPTTWKRVGYKIEPNDFIGKNLDDIRFGVISKDSDLILNTLVDGLSIIEISENEYTNSSIDELMSTYPYRGNNINFLGKDGNVENVQKWNAFSGSYNSYWASDSLFGNRTIYSQYSGLEYAGYYTNVEDKIDPNKYYFASAYRYYTGGTHGVRVILLDGLGADIGTSSFDNSTGSPQRIGYKIQPDDFGGKDLSKINFAVQGRDTNLNSGFYSDGLMLVEITQDDYALSVSDLMKKYPLIGIDDTSRSWASLTDVGDDLYLIGGYFGATYINDSNTKWGTGIWKFDTNTNTWSKTSSQLEVAGHMSFNVGGKIYIIGGQDGSGSSRDTRVLEWNPTTGEFIMKNPIPVSINRAASSAWHGVSINGKIYLRNGATTYVYNPSNDTWDFIEKQVPTNTTANWTTITGGITTSMNKLQTTESSGTDTFLYNDVLGDAQVTIRVEVLANGVMYIPFKSSVDATNKYFLEIKSDTLRLMKSVGDRDYTNAEEIKSVSRIINVETPTTYNIITRGDTISIWENNGLKIMLEDSSYSQGRFGFGSQDTMVKVNFIHVQKINEKSNISSLDLISNGSFDNDISGWTLDGDTNVSFSDGSLKISEENLTTQRSATQSISIDEEEAFALSFEANAYNLGSKGGLTFTWKNGSDIIENVSVLSNITDNNQVNKELILEVPDDATNLEIKAFIEGSTSQNGYILFDNISVKKYEPEFSSMLSTQGYVGLTSLDGKMYQFKGSNVLLLDSVFNSSTTYWGDVDSYPKAGPSAEFGVNAISLSEDTAFSQDVYLMPNKAYRIAFDIKNGTLNNRKVLPAIKITFYDSQGMPLAANDLEIKYDPSSNYGRVQVPFTEFTTPSETAYAKIIPTLVENIIEIDSTEKWILNPSFSINTANWGVDTSNFTVSTTRNTSDFYSAPSSLKLTRTSAINASGYAQVYCTNQSIKVEKGKWYKISFAANTSAQSRLTWVGIYDQKGGISCKQYFVGQNIYPGWKTYDTYFMPTNDYTLRTIYSRFSGEFDTLSVDSFSLQEVGDIELILNSSLDNDAYAWNISTANGAIATALRDTGEFDTAPASYKIQAVNTGVGASDISVYSEKLPIESGFWYKLTFRAKATTDFTIPEIKLTRITDSSINYAKIVLKNKPSISTDWDTYTVYFMAVGTYTDASIRFDLGGSLPNGESVNIDNISFKQTDDTIVQGKNSGFDINIAEWSTILSNGANVNVSHDGVEGSLAPGSLKISCINHGRDNITDSTKGDDVKVVSSELLSIATERVYKVTFRAKSTLDFTIPYVRLQKSTDPYNNYYSRSAGNLDITSSWNKYTVFLRTNSNVSDARIVFGLGNEMPNGSNLYIDDITFEEVPFHWLGDLELYSATDFFVNDMSLDAPTNTSIIDSYLVQGGDIVWVGNTPFDKEGRNDGSKVSSENKLLDFIPINLDNNQNVSIESAGTALGLINIWASKAPVNSESISTVLAAISNGDVAAWIKDWKSSTPDRFVIRDWTVVGPLSTTEENPLIKDYVGEATVQPYSGMLQSNDYTFINLIGNEGNFGVDTDEDGIADGWNSSNISGAKIDTNKQYFRAITQNGNLSKTIIDPSSYSNSKIYLAFNFEGGNANKTAKVNITHDGGQENISIPLDAAEDKTYTKYIDGSLFDNISAFNIIVEDSTAVEVLAEGEVSDPNHYTESILSNVQMYNISSIFGLQNEPIEEDINEIVLYMIEKYGYTIERLVKLNLENQLMSGNNYRIWNKYDYNGATGDWIDFKTLYGDGTQKIAYANAYINSNVAQSLIVKLTTPNNVKLFLNGTEVVVSNNSANIELIKGINRLLLKVEGDADKWYAGLEIQKPSVINPILDEISGNSIDNSDMWIKDWLVLKGFAPVGSDPRNYDYLGNETSIIPTEGMITSGKTWESFTADYTGTMLYSYGTDVSYAYTIIHSDVARKMVLRVQEDDEVKLWVNGNEVLNARWSWPDLTIDLSPGDNRILMKVYNTGGGGYGRLGKIEYLTDWLTLSSFNPVNVDNSDSYTRMYYNYIGDETLVNPNEGDVVAGKTWTKETATGDGVVLDIDGTYTMDYAFTRVYSDSDRKAILSTRLAHWAVVWVNGEYVGRADYNANVAINLKTGTNTILIKHYNSYTGYVRAYLTTTQAEQEKPSDISVLGNTSIGRLIRLYDTNVDGSNTSVQSNIGALLEKIDDNKVVYYDTSYSFSQGIIKNADAYKSALVAKGFKVKDANTLKEWMTNKLVTNSAPGTVVIFAQENVPDTILDTQDENSMLRRYLNAGGKVVWTGSQPLYNMSTSTANVVLGVNGAKNILGIELKDAVEPVAVSLSDTAKDLAFGSVTSWKSTMPILPGQGETALSVTNIGEVSGWIRNYNPEYPYSGFIRMYDLPITLSDNERNNVLKVALADVNNSAVYYDSAYPSDWVSNPSSLRTYLKSKGAGEINAEGIDYLNSGNYLYKTLVFAADVIPETFTRKTNDVTLTPTSAIISWVDNSEGESAFVIYANGVKKKTVYSDTTFTKGTSYSTAVEDLEANTTLTVKAAYFNYTEPETQFSEGDGIDFLVASAVSRKPSGLRGKTYPGDETLRNTLDISFEDTSNTEMGFEILIDGEINQFVESTSIDSIGKTYSIRFENMESGISHQIGVRNVYPTQKSVTATLDIQMPSSNIGSIRIAEAESTQDGWDKEGRGYVVLEWDAVEGATGYGIWIFDGVDYRKVQEVSEPRWDSRNAKVYPSEVDLDFYPDNSIPQDQSPFKLAGQGNDLRDIPTKLYQKTWGTEKDASTEYNVKISVINNSGEISYTDDKATFSFQNMTDAIAPEGGIILNDEEGTTKNRVVTVTLSVSDDQSGLSSVEFSENNSSWSPKYPFAPTINWTLSSSIGEKNLYCRVTDKAGNSAVFVTSIELLPVDDNPTVRLSINNGADTVISQDVMLNVTVSDDITLPGVLTVRFSNNNVTWSTWELCTKTQFPWKLTSGNTRKTVYAEVKDDSGNIGKAYVYVYLNPLSSSSESKVTIISTNSNEIEIEGEKYPAIRGRIFETGVITPPDTSEISISWDGVTWSPWEKANITGSGSDGVTIKKKLNFQGNDGWNEFYIKSKSASGIENNIISQKVLIDTKPPVAKLQTLFGATATSSSEIDVIVDVEDNASDAFMYSIGAGTKTALPDDKKITVTGIEKGKVNFIQVRIYDQAGNSTLTSIRIWGL